MRTRYESEAGLFEITDGRPEMPATATAKCGKNLYSVFFLLASEARGVINPLVAGCGLLFVEGYLGVPRPSTKYHAVLFRLGSSYYLGGRALRH